jgi:hypothetical protein
VGQRRLGNRGAVFLDEMAAGCTRIGSDQPGIGAPQRQHRRLAITGSFMPMAMKLCRAQADPNHA